MSQHILEQAWRCIEEKRWNEAIQLYQQVLENDPHHPSALYLLGLLYYRKAHFDTAIDILLKQNERIPLENQVAEVSYALGWSYYLTQQYGPSIQHYGHALKLKHGITLPTYTPSTDTSPLADFHDYLLSNACYNLWLQKYQKVEALCQQVLQSEPTHPFAHALILEVTQHLNTLLLDAVTFHQQGELTQAETKYRLLLDQKPEHAEALHGLGTLLWQFGDTTQAVHLIQKAIAIEPQALYYHINLANLFASMGQWEHATNCWTQVLRLQPDFTEAHEHLGQGYLQQQRPDLALPHYAFLLKNTPVTPGLHHTLGNVYRETKQIEQAMHHYQSALALKPDYALAHYNLGNLYLMIEQRSQAMECFKKAIHANPDFAPAQHILRQLDPSFAHPKEHQQT